MAANEKSDRAAQRRSNSLRMAILLIVLALTTALGLLHQYGQAGKPVGVDALCPFGGLESLFTLIAAGRIVQRVAWTSFILLAAMVIAALVFRRSFCGAICPLGTIQELFGRLGRRILGKRLEMLAAIDRPVRYLKYLVLAVVVILSAALSELVIRPYDPWATYNPWWDSSCWWRAWPAPCSSTAFSASTSVPPAASWV